MIKGLDDDLDFGGNGSSYQTSAEVAGRTKRMRIDAYCEPPGLWVGREISMIVVKLFVE